MKEKYVQDIFVAGEMEYLGILRKWVINVISYIGNPNSYCQADNHLDNLIWEDQL